EKRVTHRELFYKLLCDSHECCLLLRYSRHSIGIMASIEDLRNKEVVDCSMCGSYGYHDSFGDLSLLEDEYSIDARYIIVVEKYAIFQRLAEDRIFNQIPSILITAKGYIDIATRFLLHRLSRAFPHFPIFAFGWNPAWLAILGTFKFGSIGMGLEAYKYDSYPEESYVPLKPRDLQIAKSLMSCDMLQIMFPFHGFCFDFSL
ncbi:hypothetical protein MKX03_016228, partial [Papaver bracteatum]